MNKEEYPNGKLEELIALYDAGIYYTDEYIGRLLSGLKELGLRDNTLIVIVSDHGEAFLDHDLFLHKELYRPLLRVPLIYHDPRRPKGRVVTEEATLGDLMPTLLLAGGAKVPAGLDARPLPLDGRKLPRRRHFSYYHFKEDYIYEALALRDWPWKLVCHKQRGAENFTTELYNVEEDPKEQNPLEGEQERKLDMMKELIEWYGRERDIDHEKTIMTEEDLEHLRSLGYM